MRGNFKNPNKVCICFLFNINHMIVLNINIEKSYKFIKFMKNLSTNFLDFCFKSKSLIL